MLDQAHIYVSGSRAEGLPRATIEAMARGLPVVTTGAGASRELVDPRVVVAIDDRRAFVAAVREVIEDPGFYRALSGENIARAEQVAALANPERLTEFLKRVAWSGNRVPAQGAEHP